MLARLGILAFALAGGLACGPPPLPPGLEPVAVDAAAGLEPAARQQIEEARAAVAAAERAGELAPLAAAYGELGQTLHAYGLLEPAIAAYRNAERLDPESFAWAWCRGLASAQKGDAAAADAAFERARALRPDLRPDAGEPPQPDPLAERIESLARSPSALVERGRRALAAGQHDRAVDLLARAVAGAPARIDARRLLAEALQGRGDLDQAAVELEKGIAAAPEAGATEVAALHLDLGAVRRRQGELPRAIAAYRRASELTPGDVEARLALAEALAAAERWSEVEPEVAAVLAVVPGHPRARSLRGMAALRLGRAGDAATILAAVVAEAPGDVEARGALAAAFAAAGRDAEAEHEWRATAARVEGEARARVFAQLAEHLWRRGRRQGAIDAYREGVAAAPGSSWAHTQLGNALQLSDRREEAIAELARATELDPSNATAWLSEGTLHLLAGDFVTARARLEAGLARVPSDLGLAHTLARLLATAPDAALRDGRRALELAQLVQARQPSAEHADTVGMALAELGRYSEAIRFLQQSIQQLALAKADRASVAPLLAHLRLYERGEPVRIAAATAGR